MRKSEKEKGVEHNRTGCLCSQEYHHAVSNSFTFLSSNEMNMTRFLVIQCNSIFNGVSDFSFGFCTQKAMKSLNAWLRNMERGKKHKDWSSETTS